MTFDRLQPKTADEIPLLAEVLDSLHRNDALLKRQFGNGLLQISWPGHYFGLLYVEELEQLKDAIQFELMCHGATQRRTYL
jgi:hypothetical protein